MLPQDFHPVLRGWWDGRFGPPTAAQSEGWSAEAGIQSLSAEGTAVRDALAKRGALFFHELVAGTGLLPALVERGLAELAGAGIATADSFAGLRALLARQDKRRRLIETAGRWSLLASGSTESVEAVARTLLKRYGVIFRSMLQQETNLPAWRELVRIYRRLDPLNLAGILTPEARVPAIHTNRVLLQDGLPIAALEAGEVRRLAPSELSDDTLRTMLARRSMKHSLNPHLRVATARETQALANRVIH